MNRVNKSLARDILRAVHNHRAEFTPAGIYIPGANMITFGHFTAFPVGEDGELGPPTVGANKVVDEGLIQTLNLIANHAAGAAHYLAPFTGDVAVAAGWKGSTFPAVATEFTAYTAATRVPWTTVAATTPQVTNAAALADATITFNAGGPYAIRGVGLLTTSGKGSTTGRLFAASRFADDLTGMRGGSKLALQYDLSAVDEGDV